MDFNTAFCFYGGSYLFFYIPGRLQPLSSLCAREEGIKLPWIISAIWEPCFRLQSGEPLMGLVQCLGEEAGWRGYLLPKLLEFMKPWKAVLLTGVIWGLWHAPVIACGFNYGKPLIRLREFLLWWCSARCWMYPGMAFFKTDPYGAAWYSMRRLMAWTFFLPQLFLWVRR